MLRLVSNGNIQKWISLLLSPKHQGIRTYATKSHLQIMSKKVVDNMIKSDKIVIFSKSNCDMSRCAKSIFDDLRQKYTAVELDRREDGPFIQQHLGSMTGSQQIPRIFIIGKCIGGTWELIQLHNNGSLVKLLMQDAPGIYS